MNTLTVLGQAYSHLKTAFIFYFFFLLTLQFLSCENGKDWLPSPSMTNASEREALGQLDIG